MTPAQDIVRFPKMPSEEGDSMKTAYRIALAAALLASSACEKAAPPPAAPVAAVTPADPKLARLYAQTCKACHTNPSSGAPQAGDRAAWAPRLTQGSKMLIDHAVNGYKGMPPMGSCMDCTEADFAALIKFMADAP